MNPEDDAETKRKLKSESERKAKEGRLLLFVFGGVIVLLIALMFFIDDYAESKFSGRRNIHDAAEPR